jgi:hypothetical protein
MEALNIWKENEWFALNECVSVGVGAGEGFGQKTIK